MYCTSNIFSKRPQENSNSNSNNNSNGNQGGGFFGQSSQGENLGTYRLNVYRDTDPPSALMISVTNQWKEIYPYSIVTREKTIHLSVTELRIEDYYLIRNKKLKETHANQMQKWLNQVCFNQQLINNGQCTKLLPFSNERPIDIDALKNQPVITNSNDNSSSFRGYNSNRNANAFGNNGSNNQGNNNGFTNNNNSRNTTSNSNQNSNNIFSKNNQPADSNRGIFGNNTNQTGNTNNGNNLNNGNNANSMQGGNIFNNQINPLNNSNAFTNNNNNSSGNNNSGGNGNNNSYSNNSNPFNANSNNSSNNNGNSNSNNFFANFGGGIQNNNSQSNNIFNNNTSNNSNNTNNNNNQNGVNKSNIFANNNSNNNSFNNNSNNNNNNSNANNNSSNSMFANNNSNMTINRLNGNQNQAQNNSNSMFNNQNLPNNQSNQQNNPNSSNQLIQSNQNSNNSLFSNNPQFNSNFNQSNGMSMFANNSFDLLYSQAVFFDGIIKQIEQRVIDRISPFESQRRQMYQDNLQAQKREQNSFDEPFFTMKLAKSREEDQGIQVAVVYQNNTNQLNHSERIQQTRKTQIRRTIPNNDCNLLPVQSRVKNQENLFKSIKVDKPSSVFGAKKCESYLVQNFQSRQVYSVKLQVKWIDNIKDLPPEKISIKKNNIYLPTIDFTTQEGKELFICTLQEDFPVIRSDAKLVLNQEYSTLSNHREVSIVGIIEQRLFNLDMSQYEVFYSNIRKGFVYNFTITKRKNDQIAATISWEQPIRYENLDFSIPESFNLELSEVVCNLPALNSKCRITFSQLPPKIQKMFRSSGKKAANDSLRAFIENKNQQEKIFELCSVHDDGSWTFIIHKFI